MTLDDLRSQLGGQLLEPGQTGYDTARVVWNGMIDIRPAQIARCRNAADVSAAVNYFIIAILVTLFGASKWEEVLLFINRLDVGMKDPVFSRDIGFYLFTLPVIDTFKSFATLTVVLTAAATIINYFLRGGVSISERSVSLHPVRKHVGAMGIFLFGILALNFYIEAYRL